MADHVYLWHPRSDVKRYLRSIPSIDTPSTSRWTVGRQSTNFRPMDIGRSTLNRVLIKCRPSIDRDVDRVPSFLYRPHCHADLGLITA